MKKELFTILTTLLLGVSGLNCLTGCTVTLTGGGELSMGMRNDNFLVFRHTVDGDKVGKEAQSNIEAPALLEMIAGGDDDAIGTPADDGE
jgi:hypothetical protein